MYMKVKETLITKTMLKEKNSVEGFTLPCFKTYYKAPGIKIVELTYLWKNRKPRNRPKLI